MTDGRRLRRPEGFRSPKMAIVWIAGVLALLPGCDALNPAFVDFVGSNFDAVNIDPQGPDSRGHVVIAFRNDTVFDEALLQSLINTGLDPALTQVVGLRPRVRILVQITFVNGEQIQLEFNDGSASIIDPAVDPTNFPDLTQTQQDNLVVQCDVARVELATLPSVFVPSFFETIRIDPGDVNRLPFRLQVNVIPPQYELLEIDDVDEFGNTTLLRNIDVRDQPAPAIAPNCGSVITITLTGTLRLPFTVNEFDRIVPGRLDTDAVSLAASPGRFGIVVGIR